MDNVDTITSLIDESCRRCGPQPALRHKRAGTWRNLTYSGLREELESIAAGLIARGIEPGEHCALIGPSSPWWVAAYLGILRAGGVAVPIDKELKASELRHVLVDSRSRFVFLDETFTDTVLELSGDLPALEAIIALQPGPAAGDRDPELASSLSALAEAWRDLVQRQGIAAEEAGRLETLARTAYHLLSAPEGRRKTDRSADFLSPTRSLRGKWQKSGRLLTLETLRRPPEALPPSPRTPADTAVILYTSGTTGQSKGAMLSHANIVTNIRAACSHFGLDDSITTLSFLPINHVFEQVCGILLPLSLGGTVSFAESLKKLGENLAEVQPTFLLGVPAVYRMILDRVHKNVNARPLSRWLFAMPLTRALVAGKIRRRVGAETIFISGGAALDPAVAEGFRQLGLRLYQGYGITETSPVIAAESPGCTMPGSVGCPLEEVRVRIDDPNEDGVGEILVSGPNVMQGYYNNARATAQVIRDGWYHTGDLGRCDDQGRLFICGRVKNLIVTPNGKNVYPEEVENELLHSPFIAEVMVYGHKVSPSAEEIHAMIYPNQDALDDYRLENDLPPLSQEEIEDLVRREVLAAGQRLADYKRIRRFTLRDEEFPKTTTRKIKRFAVQAEISAGE